MQHLIFTSKMHSSYQIALLIKTQAFKAIDLKKKYIEPLAKEGIDPESIIAYSLDYQGKKAPVKLIKICLQNVLKACTSQGITTLLVADASYFKTLTKEGKAEPHYGYIKPCKISGYEHINVILSLNHQALFYNPLLIEKLELSLKTLVGHARGTHKDLGLNIIHSEQYPMSDTEVDDAFNLLLTKPALTCDTECYGLDLAPIATIAFAWDKHNGIGFQMQPDHTTRNYCSYMHNKLLKFFQLYKGISIYHNAPYDIKQIIFSLYMRGNYINYPKAIAGLQHMYKRIHDTKIIVYLAVNSTARNVLGLKQNAFEYTGNYALDDEDYKDISRTPMPELKKYNLIDCLGTWFVQEKYWYKMVDANQHELYKTLMLPSLKVITNMELHGIPINKETSVRAKTKLDNLITEATKYIQSNDLVKIWEWENRLKAFIFKSAELVSKVNSLETFKTDFNPSSGKQVRELLHDVIGLPITDKTPSKLPATGAKTLEKHMNQLISDFELTDEDLK